jgi:hypothetical protein
MKTLFETELNEDVRGVVYLCQFDRTNLVLIPTHQLICSSISLALELYANIPNPASQIATGKTYDELCQRLEQLHANMKDKNWLEGLKEQI